MQNKKGVENNKELKKSLVNVIAGFISINLLLSLFAFSFFLGNIEIVTAGPENIGPFVDSALKPFSQEELNKLSERELLNKLKSSSTNQPAASNLFDGEGAGIVPNSGLKEMGMLENGNSAWFNPKTSKYFIEDTTGNMVETTAENLKSLGLDVGIDTAKVEVGESWISKLLGFGKGTFADAIATSAQWALGAYGIVKLGSSMFGVSKTTSDALSLSAAAGIGTYKFLGTLQEGTLYDSLEKTFSGFGKYSPLKSPGLWGIGAAALVFVLTYKKTSIEIVEFNCLPYQPPVGGADCELCNEIEGGCSEYRCRSLGQACQLLNAGTEDEKCAWVNPHDVTSPLIKITSVLKGHIWKKDGAVRPPATGIVISQESGDCIEPFTPLEFSLVTDEPSQCKVDYNLTTSFEEMNYYFGGSSLFSYNHTETMSLPGPDAINAIAPELKNDGTYTLYVRCQDANGNFNQDAFSVRFCVKPGPDTTPPRIVDLSIPSKSAISYNETELYLEVYVNEPAECKWSREDRNFDNMENSMACSTNLWEMNNNNVYTCKTILTGIEDRKENNFYFRCKDQPGIEEGDRNVNTQSYKYTIYGTQPLNILEVGPNETTRGSTGTIPVKLYVKTDNGYDNGRAFCYYYNDKDNKAPAKDEDYILFLETDSNKHSQRQDLATGTYTYYFKCVDLGGNAAYDSTTFSAESDNSPPVVVRAYKEGELKIITNENSVCTYSNKDCNFNIEDGIAMPYDNDTEHRADWKMQNYYIRCKDEYNNQPSPNTCSIIVKPYNLLGNVIEL